MPPVLQTDWNDFGWFIQTYLPRQTIPTLKQFGDKIYEYAKIYVPIRSGERKQDITQKVQVGFQQLRATNDLALYARIRQACELIGVPVRPPTYGYQGPPPTFGGVPAPAASSSNSSSFQNPNYNRPGAAANGYGGSYHAAGPSRTGQGGFHQAANRPPPQLQDWRPNPMWKPVRALTEMAMLPDISANDGSHVRRERKTPFSIPNDVLEKLNYTRANPQSHPRYAVRLFCTSSDYFRAPGQPIQPGQGLVTNRNLPIEYPSNPDITVDNYNLPFKEKGLRGKAGSAPPFDLEKGPNGLSRVPGRMLSVTLGHTGPSLGKKKDISKKFSYQIVFTEMTSKEELLKRLNGLEPTNAEEALNEFKRKQEEDDDIVVGTSMMSVKDPLSYMRMTRPVRSSKCTHIQCFDAQWWIESNVQHPQWHCPHCNKELQFPDLIVDGYVMGILKAVPDSYDDVVLEPDGEWHTEDGKYGSKRWMADHGNAASADTKPDVPASDDDASPQPDGASKRKIVEILLSDSDDDDEEEASVPLAKVNGTGSPASRPTIPLPRLSYAGTPNLSVPSTSRPSSTQPANVIIDLTLSDSEDDDTNDEEETTGPPPFRQPGAGTSLPSAVESPRLRLTLSNADFDTRSKGDPVARPSSTYVGTGGRVPVGGMGGGGVEGRGNGTGVRPYPDFYDDTGRNNAPNNPVAQGQGPARGVNYETQRWVPPPRPGAPPTQPRAPAQASAKGVSDIVGSKRPRADDWMGTPDSSDFDPRPIHGSRDRTNVDQYGTYPPRTDPHYSGITRTANQATQATHPSDTSGMNNPSSSTGYGGPPATFFSTLSSAQAYHLSHPQTAPPSRPHPIPPAVSSSSSSTTADPHWDPHHRHSSIPTPLDLSPRPFVSSPALSLHSHSLSPVLPSIRGSPRSAMAPSGPGGGPTTGATGSSGGLARLAQPIVRPVAIPLRSPSISGGVSVASPSMQLDQVTPPLPSINSPSNLQPTFTSSDTPHSQVVSATSAAPSHVQPPESYSTTASTHPAINVTSLPGMANTSNQSSHTLRAPSLGPNFPPPSTEVPLLTPDIEMAMLNDEAQTDDDAVSRQLGPSAVPSPTVSVSRPKSALGPESANPLAPTDTAGVARQTKTQTPPDSNTSTSRPTYDAINGRALNVQEVTDETDDNDDDAPVRSSSLGLGEEEEMFWDGVLNGGLTLD